MNNITLNIKSLLLNATQALRENKFIEGKKILEQIQSINSNILEVNFNLAILNLQSGNLEAAIIFFTKAKKINPKSTKEIFKFLNLDWSNKAKDFYKTAKDRIDISTPSYNQVTSPLYLKSINRWKNYEENFIEVKNDLQRWTHEFEYKV